MPDTTVEEAVTRNAQALLTGNFAQIFADMTPEAMAKVATLGGGQMTGQMPVLTSYDVISREQDGDDYVYEVTFNGTPAFRVTARWREIGGQWKLVDFDGSQVSA